MDAIVVVVIVGPIICVYVAAHCAPPRGGTRSKFLETPATTTYLQGGGIIFKN